MKENHATNKGRRHRCHPTVTQCVLAMLLGGWLVMVEVYIWFTKFDTLISWIFELHQVWTGGIIGSAGTFLILFVQNRIKKKKRDQHLKIRLILQVILGVFRTFELLLALYHFDIFLSWWPQSFLTYATIGWIVAIICLLLGVELYDKLRSTQH